MVSGTFVDQIRSSAGGVGRWERKAVCQEGNLISKSTVYCRSQSPFGGFWDG